MMFCDLVGSTEISTRLDPEDLSELLRTYQVRVSAAIERFGGFIAQYLGDGVKAYFGWPVASESDAERAIQAALAVREEVSSVEVLGEILRVRIGIASGLVVVGDQIGSGPSLEQTAVGETPNRAARLQALAEPGRIVVDAATRRRVGDLFEFRELGAVTLKGLAAPVEAFEAVDAREFQSRFEALRALHLSPLIGRAGELALLAHCWRQAKQGEGRAVLVSGEAGIGKSRLLAALEEQLRGEALIRLRYFCSPYQSNTPLHPIIGQIEFAAGFARTDGSVERMGKLDVVLDATATPSDDRPLLAELLSLPGGRERQSLSAQRRKELTSEALLRQVERLSEQRPLLLLFEDLHWSDASTIELLELMLARLHRLPALVVATFRPEFIPPWTERDRVTVMPLSRLDQVEAASLAREITSGGMLPQPLLERVVAQADGNPLFIEELTKAVVEEQAVAGPFHPVSVPATLQASLLSRLDRLPAAKQVAQTASVIGREFSHVLLGALSDLADTELTEGLTQLTTSGIVFAYGDAPNATYAFKHALVQEAAYDSVLRSRRLAIHTRLVDILERDVKFVSEQPALLGYHAAMAGLTAKAASYYRSVGEHSSKSAAFAETRSLLGRGLELTESLPDSPAQRGLRAELLIALTRILQMLNGLMDPEATALAERALAVARTLDQPELLIRARLLRFLSLVIIAKFRAASKEGEELSAIGHRTKNLTACVLGALSVAYVEFHRGHFAAVGAGVSTARSLSEPASGAHFSVPAEASYFQSAAVFSAMSLACQGYLDQASSEISSHYQDNDRLTPLARAFGLSHICRFDLVILRDLAAFQRHTEMLMALSVEHGFSQFKLLARANIGWLGESVQQFRLALDALAVAGYRLFEPYYQLLLAEALCLGGQTSDAQTVLDVGIELAVASEDAWCCAELHRRKGELFASDRLKHADAESELTLAINLAREQSARLFELRATVSLVRLWIEQHRTSDAYVRLAEICSWFTEGLATPELVDARVLLDELRTRPEIREIMPI